MSLPRILIAMLLPAVMAAQVRARQPVPHIADSSAAVIVANARAEGPHRAAWLVDILRQREGSQPTAKLDTVADGLTNDIIAASARSANDGNVVSAISLIVNAGSPAAEIGVP